MFGISWAEFLVIIIVAMAVIPTRNWPDVARFLARGVKFIRDLVWKISDNVEQIKDQIDIEKPITELSQKTMDDVMSAFRETAKPKTVPVKKPIKNPHKKTVKASKTSAHKKTAKK